jgi:hypothetical protein
MSDDYGRRSSSYDPSEQAKLPTAPREFSFRHQSVATGEKPLSSSLFEISEEGRESKSKAASGADPPYAYDERRGVVFACWRAQRLSDGPALPGASWHPAAGAQRP